MLKLTGTVQIKNSQRGRQLYPLIHSTSLVHLEGNGKMRLLKLFQERRRSDKGG
jgi:hypothetical protein